MAKQKKPRHPAKPETNTTNSNSSDSILFISVICLLIIGLLTLFSITWYICPPGASNKFLLFKRQLAYMVVGLSCLYLSRKISYQVYKHFALVFYLISLLLLCIVLLPGIGVKSGGAQRWLRIPLITFSPTVIAEISLVFYLARSLSANIAELNKLHFRYMLVAILVIPAVLIFKQPHFAAGMLYIIIGALILFLGRVRLLHLYLIAFIVLPFIHASLYAPYRTKRLLSFIRPWEDPVGTGYQIIQSYINLGSGGLIGVGFGKGIGKHYYLPGSHSDFILSNLGEEFGFLGTLLIITLFLILVVRGFMVAFRTKEHFGRLLAAGITIWIAAHAVSNIYFVCGLMPIGGLMLPFISYGGTGIVLQLFSIGVLLNISSQTHTYTDYPGIMKNLVKRLVLGLLNKTRFISAALEVHPAYRLLVILSLILTILVCVLQLLFWFWLKR